jgi:hypothetical protein
VRHFCVQTDAERLRAGDGYGNVRFFGEAAECRRRHSEPERCASRQGAEGLRLSVCHYCHYLAALGECQPRVSPGSEGTSNGRRHFDPSEIESSARSDGGRKVVTSHVFTFSVNVTLPVFTEPPDTLTLEAGIEPEPAALNPPPKSNTL